MIITLDLGNSDLVVNVFKDDKIKATIRVKTDIESSADEYAKTLYELLLVNRIDYREITGCVISSVVPPLNGVLKGACMRLFTCEPIFLDKGIKTGLKIVCDNPSEVGADLIADSVGALYRYQAPAIIVDLGTASKFIVVDKNESFIGVIIAPGIKTSKNALVSNTSKLPNISMTQPKKVIGKNTQDSMNSGVCYGFASMVDGMIQRIEEELGYKTTRILTGGLGKVIYKAVKEEIIYDRDLISYGLLDIYKRNKENI